MKKKMAFKFKSYKKINRHSRIKAKRRCAIGSINPKRAQTMNLSAET
jgi:hypothetical protein